MFSATDIISKSKQSFPCCRCIYFLIDDDEIVYVGQSVNIYFRFMCHGISGKIFNRISWIDIGDADLDETEADYIIKFNPKYNNSLPICDKYTRNTIIPDLELRSEIEDMLTPLYSFSRKYSTGIITIHVYHTNDFLNVLERIIIDQSVQS